MPTPETETPVRANAYGCITLPFLLIACIPLAWGARSSWADGELLRSGEVARGSVTEIRYVPENPSVRLQRKSGGSPIVKFTTRAGEARTVIGSVNRYPAPWAVGETDRKSTRLNSSHP